MSRSKVNGSLLILIAGLVLHQPAKADRPKFSDNQIVAMTPGYFKKMRQAPDFLGAEVYRHPQRGKVFQVNLKVNRNNETESLGYAFDAMLALSQYFKRPPKQFVAVLHSDSKGIAPVVCTGDAKCTISHFIHQRITYKEWYTKCITFQGQ